MNVNLLRFLDRWLGLTACILLTFHRRLAEQISPFSSKAATDQSILFVKLAEMGATVTAVPVLRNAVERYGRGKVYFLVFEQNRIILDLLNIIPPENVISIPNKGMVSTLFGLGRAILRMRKIKITAAINLEQFKRGSVCLTYLSGARIRAGFESINESGPYCGRLMTHPLVFSHRLHISQLYLTLFEAIHRSPEDLPCLDYIPELPQSVRSPLNISVESTRQMVDLITNKGVLKSKPFIILNPNINDVLRVRKWPEKHFVELAKLLLNAFPSGAIALTGPPDEKAQMESLRMEVGSKRCHSLAGQTSFENLFSLYEMADLIVTGDCGPPHFASLTLINILTLFGPIGHKVHSMWNQIACSPCFSQENRCSTRCKSNTCLQSIRPEDVFHKCIDILSPGRPLTTPIGVGTNELAPPVELRIVESRPGKALAKASLPNFKWY